MTLKFILWQVWPDEPEKPWVYRGIIYAENLETAMEEFRNMGCINDYDDCIITM